MPVKSANRSLAMFELFAARQTPLSISDISQEMSIPQSSASMLVKSLVELGYLEHDRTARTYYPTFRIALLGTWMRRRHEKTGRLPRLASKVAEATGETVVLAMRNGIFAQYALVQLGADPLRLHVESRACSDRSPAAPVDGRSCPSKKTRKLRRLSGGQKLKQNIHTGEPQQDRPPRALSGFEKMDT